jgi:hypothetical protein
MNVWRWYQFVTTSQLKNKCTKCCSPCGIFFTFKKEQVKWVNIQYVQVYNNQLSRYTMYRFFTISLNSFRLGHTSTLYIQYIYKYSNLLELQVCWSRPALGSTLVPCFSSAAFPKLFRSVIVSGMLSLATRGVMAPPHGLVHMAWPNPSVHTVHFFLANFVTFYFWC